MIYCYIRSKKHPIGVIAFERRDDGSVWAATSLCRKGDRWDREQGISTALERLMSNGVMVARRENGVMRRCYVGLFRLLIVTHPSIGFYANEERIGLLTLPTRWRHIDRTSSDVYDRMVSWFINARAPEETT